MIIIIIIIIKTILITTMQQCNVTNHNADVFVVSYVLKWSFYISKLFIAQADDTVDFKKTVFLF